MTEESSNLFQNDNAEFEEIFETDIVGQMNKEDQQALKKKILEY